jgi:hypothetical protein
MKKATAEWLISAEMDLDHVAQRLYDQIGHELAAGEGPPPEGGGQQAAGRS